MSRNLTIRKRLILTFAILFLASTSIMGFITYRNATRRLHQNLDELPKNEDRLFHTILTADAKGLVRAQSGLTRVDRLLSPFARRDRAGLAKAARLIFQDLREKNKITNMYFIAPDGTVYFRAHKPEQFGDRLTRATFLKAAETHQTSYGLEMGRNFFSLRCVAPLSYKGKEIGYLEVAEEVDHIFRQMKEITGNDASIFLAGEFLSRYPVIPGTENVNGYALLYPTNRAVAIQLADSLKETFRQGLTAYRTAVVDLHGARYQVGMGPIREASGATAGVLFSYRDVSPLYAAMWRRIAGSIALFATIYLTSTIFLYLSLRKSILLFNTLRKHLQKVTNSWELGRRLNVTTGDEIGALTEDRMTEKLAEMVDKVVREMTEQKKAQEEIRKLNEELELKAQQLSESNRDLESFSYSLSHDLRSPLTRIYAAAQLLQVEYDTVLDQEGQQLVGVICGASLSMEKLVEAMLLFAQAGGSEICRTEVDLTEAATAIAEELHQSEPERQVEIVIAPGLVAHGDRQILTAALKNLMWNAWKYTRDAARPRIEFTSSRQGDEQIFMISDNGAGFDMRDAELIFKPFYRHHDANRFPGLGIGLSTVQRIIERHGGRIWGEGKPGEGANFYFTLP